MNYRPAVSNRSTTIFLISVFALLLSGPELHAQGGGGAAERAAAGTSKAFDGQVRITRGSFPNYRLEVRLELHGQLVDRAYTDGRGRFMFTELGGNTNTVVIAAEGYQRASEQVRISADQRGPKKVFVSLRPIGEALLGPSLGELTGDLPGEARKAFEKGMEAAGKGKTDKAVQQFEKVIELAPEFQPAYVQDGLQHIGLEDFEAAEKTLRKASELDPKDPGAFFNLGNVYLVTQRFELAEKALLNGLTQAPESAFGHYILGGTVRAMTGRLAEAEQGLLKALEADPGMAMAKWTLISVYLNQHKDQQALEQMRGFLDQLPEHPRAPQIQENLAKMEAWLQSQQ